MILHGIGASEGIGIGKAVCVREQNLDYSAVSYGGKEVEKDRLQAAIQQFNERTSAMAEHIRAQVGQKESEILTGQIAMLGDPFMQSQMTEIIEGGQCAEAAVDQVCTMYAEMFAGVDDELMRQRATDVRDIRGRLLAILLKVEGVDVSELPAGSVLVAHDLTPSMTVGLKKENVAAILTETGGRTSHSAILARALELPAVLSVPKALELVKDGDGVIVDGGEGVALLNPDQLTRGEYLKKQEEYQKKRALLAVYRDRETVDADGKRYGLYANIGSPAEAEAAAATGAEGVGLFRTEFLFMDRTSVPSETEQMEAYQAVSRTMAGKEVIIRTLDVGGDKAIDYLGMDKEENPFLGHRAIRYCLDRPDLYKVQLRALLRAGAELRNIKIMLPLVTSLEEIRGARALLEQCKSELESEGLPYDKDISLGIMVETPAAALIADLLAQESDFFSIGTNDLTQYVMAVDRGNAKVEKLYTTFHPAVLRSIRNVIQTAKQAGIPVGMCGEAAADPCLIPLLMSWGLDEFSVSASSVLATRARIHHWRSEEAGQVAQEAMSLSTAAGVQGYLKANARD
ncbi:phosphoenolpyruvate--protein phosphotransferase [Pseudoflavonifractor phocaeensis]|uniref:phosphoenolpyruvate--protein phosphotransferase n=1 Tax=Pseudoflavonifractor phocaeensis TaxID=1870988 RepID=UPI00195A80A4|nr:phosphoenolpyruvate--protein phosphotransferase [Pseudoflavonifractor phocaeensis]MBM6886961.1 phosphoenolpyruvate--protein phosphotransferase [Pseudoflavonifractor phocaeensis]